MLHYVCCRRSGPPLLGYVLEIGYDTITIITSDPYKIAVGEVPRKLTVNPDSLLSCLPPYTTRFRRWIIA